jgi:serine protease AprX
MRRRQYIQNTIALVVLLVWTATITAYGLPTRVPATPPIKVIVEATSVEQAITAVQANGGEVTAEIGIINAVVALVPENKLTKLEAASGVIRVTPDRPVKATGGLVDVEFTKAVGLSEVWEAGNTGAGVTVAVLDTGIDPTFLGLRRAPRGRGDRLLAYYDAPSAKLYEAPRLLRSPRDPNGHGTHVAGIIGNSIFEWRDREYQGVAPSVDLVAIRVLDKEGVGRYTDVIQGIDWAVQHKEEYNIRVLNISLYAPAVAPYWADPLNLAAMAAWQAGIVVVTSAGNDGPEPLSIGVPGNTPYVVTVGAFTDNYTPQDLGDDYIPPFSASGPTLDAFVKPDVIAPGAHITSLMHRRAYLRSLYPDSQMGSRYFEMTGTSMSAAVVSGVAALMLSENPDLTPNQVKYRLAMTARPQFSEYSGEAAYSIWEQGAGRVWAPDAVFTDMDGEANWGMDLAADLDGTTHYQGWTVYDPDTGEFRVEGDGYHAWAGGYNAWAGGYHAWAGGYSAWASGTTNWSGDFNDWLSAFDSWIGGYNAWAGDYSAWASGYSAWAGGYNAWAGGYNAWAGGYSAWAGGYSAWAGGYSAWAGNVGDPAWAAAFANLENAPAAISGVSINTWVGDE